MARASRVTEPPPLPVPVPVLLPAPAAFRAPRRRLQLRGMVTCFHWQPATLTLFQLRDMVTCPVVPANRAVTYSTVVMHHHKQ